MTKIELHHAQFPNTFYFKKGSGPLAIWIHGFAEDHSIWNYQVEELSQRYCCVLPDLPGTGVSSLSAETLSIKDMAEFIHAIVLQEQSDKVILLGHSMGGYIALAYAEKYMQFLTGFGLIHSTAYADDEAKKENRRKSIRLIEGEGKGVFLKAMVPNLYAEESRINVAEDMAHHLTKALEISSLSLTTYYKAMIERKDRTRQLKEMRCPVLFVIGKQDNAVPYRDMLAQSAIPGQSVVHLLGEVGHTGMLEAPKKLNSILNKYCEYLFEGKLP